MLLGIEDGILVLDEHDPLAVARRLARDARQGVVLGVLAIKPPQKGDGRLVKDVAMEHIFHKAVEETQRKESDDPLPDRRQQLRLPGSGRNKFQGAEQRNER